MNSDGTCAQSGSLYKDNIGSVPGDGVVDATSSSALLDGKDSVVGRTLVILAAISPPAEEIVACGMINLVSTPSSSQGIATHQEASGSDFTYAIYEDADIFNYWQYWVSRNEDRATPAQMVNRLKFSTYAIEVKCTTGDTDGKGCCLQDMSEEANGGWCLI